MKVFRSEKFIETSKIKLNELCAANECILYTVHKLTFKLENVIKVHRIKQYSYITIYTN